MVVYGSVCYVKSDYFVERLLDGPSSTCGTVSEKSTPLGAFVETC